MTQRLMQGENMGRPLQNEATLRLRIDCYLSPSERVEIATKAQEAGLPMSVFLRRSALAQKIHSHKSSLESVEKWRDLSTLASNLNQCLIQINSGKLPHLPLVLIEDLTESVRRLRLEIIGRNEK
jgi:hypothetical protein